LFHKLLGLILCAALLPLAALGLLSARSAETALRRRIEEHHLKLAENGAELVALHLDNATNQLRAIAQYPNLRSSPEVARGVLRVAYRQIEDVAALGLLDEDGTQHCEAVFLPDPEQYGLFRDHEAVAPAQAAELLARAARQPAPRKVEIGPVRAVASGRTRMTVRLPVVADRPTAGALTLVAELSLRGLAKRISALSSAGAEATLLDAAGRAIGSDGAISDHHSVEHPQGVGAGPAVSEYIEDASKMLGAFAPVRGYGLAVLVRQRVQSAYAPIGTLKSRTLEFAALSALLAVALAALFTRSVAGRVRRLAAGAAEIGAGRLEVRVPAHGGDEVAELGRSMNEMAERLRTQRDEILDWNRTLEARVEEKTRALREAQELLLRSQKLAAVGELGAGMAHEINNPLAGVLGMTQLALLDLPEGTPAREPLQEIEKQALRIKEIVANLLRFTQESTGSTQPVEAVDVRRVLDDALALVGPSALAQRGIQVERRFGDDLPQVRAVPGQLQEAFVQILTNARNAMPRGGQLVLEASQQNGKLVQVRIVDTGSGIRPEHLDRIFDPFFTTKAEWGATGLGLSIVHKIVEAHGGKIAVESALGQGASFTLTLPADAGRLHLV
jgi:signal transduction histidine kinase